MRGDDAWTLLSRPHPPATRQAALAVDPTTGAALLIVVQPPRAATAIWRWAADRWTLEATGILAPEGGITFQGPPLWIDDRERGPQIARIVDGGLCLAPRAQPDARRILAAPTLRGVSAHAWALRDPARGRSFLVAGVGGESRTFAVGGEALTELARGPLLTRAALDGRSGALVGVDASGRGHRFDGRAWAPAAAVSGSIDAMTWSPLHEAVIGFEAVDERGRALRVLGDAGWRAPPVAVTLPTFTNQAIAGVDRASGQIIVFGGQDLERGGGPTRATWSAARGRMRASIDPALPASWGRYNALCGSERGLIAVDQSARRAHRREGGGWVEVGRLEVAGAPPGSLDDRALNFAAAGDLVLVLDRDGRLLGWPIGHDPMVLSKGSGETRDHGSQRTALAWDPRGRRALVVGGVDRSDTQVAEGGSWRRLVTDPSPPPGVSVAASTPAGVYLLSAWALHRLDGDGWVHVAPPVDGGAVALLHVPGRGTLLAAHAGGIDLAVDGGWRRLAALPRGCLVGEGAAQVGVDVPGDALVIVDGDHLWSLALAALDWRGAILPTTPCPQPERPLDEGDDDGWE